MTLKKSNTNLNGSYSGSGSDIKNHEMSGFKAKRDLKEMSDMLEEVDFSPEEDEGFEVIITDTGSLADEIEDFRLGSEIAADLRDLVHQFPESKQIPDLKARVFGKMVRMQPSEKFLNLMMMILNQEEEAKEMVQMMIDEIKQETSGYEFKPEEEIEYSLDQEEELSQLSQREINELIHKSLDKKDFDRAKILMKYVKGSKRNLIEEKIKERMSC